MVWHNVARLDALGDGDVIGVEVAGTPVALYRIGGAIYATDGMCTHATGLLADGWVEDGAIECPLHQARFDIRTGKALCEPATEDLRTYPVKIEGADVLIDLEGTRPSHDSAWVVAGDRPTTTGAQGCTAAVSHDDREQANLASGVGGTGTLRTRQYV